MAKVKLSATDAFMHWLSTADLVEVNEVYERVKGVVALRRRGEKKQQDRIAEMWGEEYSELPLGGNALEPLELHTERPNGAIKTEEGIIIGAIVTG